MRNEDMLDKWNEALNLNSDVLSAIYKNESDFKSKFMPRYAGFVIERMSFDSKNIVVTLNDCIVGEPFNFYVCSWDVVYWLISNDFMETSK